MLQKAIDITDEILAARFEVDPNTLGTEWHQVVLLHFSRSFQALAGTRLLAVERLYNPAVVLCRYLFELGVNIRYLNNAPDARVPVYLRHGGFGEDAEEREEVDRQLQDLREMGDDAGISTLLVPGKSWKNLKKMCTELDCLNHYLTMYRSTSQLAHAGAQGLGREMLAWLEKPLMAETEIPGVLLTAVTYHQWVLEVCNEVFPGRMEGFNFDHSWAEQVNGLVEEVVAAGKAQLEQARHKPKT